MCVIVCDPTRCILDILYMCVCVQQCPFALHTRIMNIQNVDTECCSTYIYKYIAYYYYNKHTHGPP